MLNPRNVATFLRQPQVDEWLKDDAFASYVNGTLKENGFTLSTFFNGKTCAEGLKYLDDMQLEFLQMKAVEMEDESALRARSSLPALLNAAGLKAVNVPDDGHCAFHALAVAKGGGRRQAFEADRYAANDQHRLDLRACSEGWVSSA